MYDVRFGNDSTIERFCKALQFGVMIGLAIVGPSYTITWKADTLTTEGILQTYKTLSFIFMGSRFLLAVQYGLMYLALRTSPKAWIPCLMHIVIFICTASVFPVIASTFKATVSDDSAYGMIGWYIIVTFEAILILVVSEKFSFMSLRYTLIVERLGSLTLIILGEGIIDLWEQVTKFTLPNFAQNVIGQIFSSLAIVYLIWMLYYDQTEKKKFNSSWRLATWTPVHFLLHMAILLVVEGQAVLTKWMKFLNVFNPIFSFFSNDPTWNHIAENSTFLLTDAAFDTFLANPNQSAEHVLRTSVLRLRITLQT